MPYIYVGYMGGKPITRSHVNYELKEDCLDAMREAENFKDKLGMDYYHILEID